MTPEQRIDNALDSVLRASGSALKHYTMPKTLADMRAAMRKVMSDSYIQGSKGLAEEREAEREACAKVCEEIDDRCPECAAHNDHEQCQVPEKEQYAAAIRARSSPKQTEETK